MAKQQTLAMAEDQGSSFARYAKPTRRDEFLKAMEALVPCSALCEEIQPHYPKPGNGRPPVGLERMLRMYCVQHWFNLADQACEEALYDSASLRRFVGIDLGGAGAGRDDLVAVPSFAGDAQAGRSVVFTGQRGADAAWLQAADRDDRGCDDHRCAEFDEEP